MKRKVILITMIVILGLLLTGASLAMARVQYDQVHSGNPDPSLPPAMNWERVTEHGFVYSETNIGAVTALEVFSGSLYASTTAASTGAGIYRSEDGTSWVRVNEPGFGLPLPTSDPPCNFYWYYMWDMAVFNDELYVPLGLMCMDPAWYYYGGQIWRTGDGLTWTPVVTDSFGYTNTQAVNILTEFEGMLYAGTVDNDTGLQIWRSATGDAGDWEDVTPDDLAMPALNYANDFQVYQGKLFVTTQAITTSGESQLWFTADGEVWEEGPMEMFTCEPVCWADNLEVLSDTLYMGVANTPMGGELWSTNDGISWTLAASTGDSNLYQLTPVGVFDGYMYLGGQNWDGLGYHWRTADGTNLEVASLPAFDRTTGAAIFPNGSAVFGEHLYLGKYTWELGGSVWRDTALNFWLPFTYK